MTTVWRVKKGFGKPKLFSCPKICTPIITTLETFEKQEKDSKKSI